MPVDLGTLARVDPGQVGAVGGRDRRADRTVALSYADVVTQTACWEERSQVCDEIRLALAEVRRRTPSAEPASGPRGTTPRLTVRGTAAGAPPPPPPPPPPLHHSTTPPLHHSTTPPLHHSTTLPLRRGQKSGLTRTETQMQTPGAPRGREGGGRKKQEGRHGEHALVQARKREGDRKHARSTQRARAPVNRSQEAQDTAHTTPRTKRASR